MLGDGGAAHLEVGGDVADGTGPLAERLEDGAAGRIRERHEDGPDFGRHDA